MFIGINMGIVGSLMGSASILALFASGEVGVWFDPTDITTLYQDVVGTTPITAPGQTCALMLDKSKGLALGPELVTNGDFSAGTTGWVLGAGWSISGGSASRDATAGGSNLTGGSGVEIGKTYRVTWTQGPTTVAVYLGSPSGPLLSNTSTAGTYSVLVAATVTGGIVFRSAATVTGIDNISVKELAGNHATQTTAAQRPTYGIIPYGGVRNLLTYTEQFDNAGWSKNNATVVANFAVDPNGDMTAEKLIPNSGINISTTAVFMLASQTIETRTLTAFMKKAEYSKGFLRVGGGSPLNAAPTAVYDLASGTVLSSQGTSVTASISPVGSGWYRCSLTYKNGPNAAGTGQAYAPNVGAVSDIYSVTSAEVLTTANGTSGILIWGAQLEVGSTATTYQKVVSKYEVTEAGKAPLGVLYPDGIDDWMVTPSINFTGTDKMTIWAGLQKMSDPSSLAAAIAELGTQADANNGAFLLFGRDTFTPAMYEFGSRGTTFRLASTNSATLAAPNTSILTGISDISGDVVTLMVNNVVAATSAADQGTGNYGNYPLYLFRRGGASLPFNGIFTGLIVRGAASSAAQISNANAFLNSELGAY